MKDAAPNNKKRLREEDDDCRDFRPMSVEDRSVCLQMLTEMRQQKDAYIFEEPPDWKGLCLPRYPIVIKQPMDFSTIEVRRHAFLPDGTLIAALTFLTGLCEGQL